MANNNYYRLPGLLDLPLELLLKISEYLSFADLWYLATTSHHCKAISYQIIWHRYHIDLSKPQYNPFNHIVHAALAYISRYGYTKNKIDHAIIQSVSNRLAVEIYDRSPLKNWEPCLDFFLDKTLGIILDHVFFDPLLDTVQTHTRFDLVIKASDNNNINNILLDQSTVRNHSLITDFYPTKFGRLITSFLTTLYPTMIALFETNPTTEIHHRLLLNHINRHLDSLSTRYQQHHKRRLLINNSSPRPSRVTALAAIQQHNEFLRLNFRILIRFIGTLVQTELISTSDLNLITRQRIQFFFLTFQQPELKNHTCWQIWLEEIEFQMEIFLDLTSAILLLQQSDDDNNNSQITNDLNIFSTMLDNTVSALISTRSNNLSSNTSNPSI